MPLRFFVAFCCSKVLSYNDFDCGVASLDDVDSCCEADFAFADLVAVGHVAACHVVDVHVNRLIALDGNLAIETCNLDADFFAVFVYARCG